MSSDSQPAAEDLGRRVRALRLRRFLTQEQLADASGIGRATIARLEAGRSTPHLGTVKALASALHVEPEELVRDPDALWGLPAHRLGDPTEHGA